MEQSPFWQARLKRKWADHRIGEAIANWNEFLKTDFCELRVEPDPEFGGEIIRIHSFRPLPPWIVLAVGDAIHNLRASLDYVLSELLQWKDTRRGFPMGETRDELESSFRTEGLEPCAVCGRGAKGKGRNAPIEEALPGFGRMLVDEIRPYKAANGFLWPLNKLDVRDKHRLIAPVVSVQKITGIGAVDDNGNRMIDCTARVGSGGIGRVITFGAGGVKIEDKGKAAADILFDEAGIVERLGVFETLANMAQAVDETIDLIASTATKKGWITG